ncbi:MAG: DUF1820 family protein [Gammaproteobacteria bacterium]|nr:DUF1820 family protein [Gammaproteobacteria bacterium]
MTKRKHIYKVVFHNQGKVYELYAGEISQGELYGFVEVADIIFGERSSVLVDPSEERLKGEFAGVKRTYIPMHAVIRMDEVEKEGTNKIVATDGSNVTPFPINPVYPPSTPGGSGESSSD